MWCFIYFLRNWSMQSYSVFITCSRMASLDPHSLLTPNGFQFYNEIYTKCYFTLLQTHFSRDPLFVGLLWSCSRRVGDSRWWGSLTMVPAGNKAKRFLSVNHNTKTIHHHHIFPRVMVICLLLLMCFIRF